MWIQEAIAGNASGELTLARSARLARVGARAARVARLARVLRAVKLVKIAMLAKTGRRAEGLDDHDDDSVSVPSFIMEHVSDNVTRHVVATVLASAIGAAALQFYEEDQAASAAFAVMTEASATSKLGQTLTVEEALPNMYYLSITKFDAPLIDRREEQHFQDLRASETVIYKTGPDDDCVDCLAMVDTSGDNVHKAVLNISLICLIIIVLVVASLSLTRETVQIVLEPTAKLMRVTRTSRALMSVFRAVADSDGKDGLDKTIGTVLDAALTMLDAEVVNMYFVDSDGEAKLHQTARDGETEGADAKGSLYAHEVSIGEMQTDTVVGSVIDSAKQNASTQDNSKQLFFANLLWAPELDGVVDMARSPKKTRSLKRRMSMRTGSSAAFQATEISHEWTDRWQGDPSINGIKLQAPGSARYLKLVGPGAVRNQLCMAIVAEVGGRHRVVGMVQAFNRRLPRKHVRYEGDIQLSDLAFTQEDVNSLQVFCMQIADLVQLKLKEVEYEDALNRTDGIGSMLRALELEQAGVTVTTPRTTSGTNRTRHHTLKEAAEAVRFASRTALARKSDEYAKLPIDQLRCWGHGCLDYSLRELAHYTVQMFDDLGLLGEFQIPSESLLQFADLIFASYNKVPYHNAYHAFNVLQGCYVFCSTMHLGKNLLKKEQLALLVSALGHDSGHDGVANAFHIGCESEIATMYNDLSPLENMHARRTLSILKDEDIMAAMVPAERQALKGSMVSLIIATDMKFHKDKELKLAKVCRAIADTWQLS